MTEIDSLCALTGLRSEPYGSGWKLYSPTGVPLFVAFLRGTVGGGKRWVFDSVFDLTAATKRSSEAA